MSLEFRLAWRNVWRNPRRTGLTLAATVFAVVLVMFFVAMAAGLHGKMIEDSVRLHSGHLEIAGDGYLEDQSFERFLHFDPELERILRTNAELRGYAPRIIGFALISKQTESTGIALFGVDPAREGSVSTLPDRVREGRFVSPLAEPEIVLGERLARNLGAEIGDELLLYSVAYSLEGAYELFRVVGIMKLPDPSLDRSLAVISLAEAQDFFVYGDRVTEVALRIRDADHAPALAARLEAELATASADAIEVNTWEELMPELVQFIFIDDASMYILLVILVVVVAFGIFNTILMSVLERTRELGVMLAVGLPPGAVFRLVYIESMLLALVGLAIGLAIALPLVLYFVAHPVALGAEFRGAMEMLGIEPVLTWKLKPLNPLGTIATIFAVAAVAALYPARKASRGRPVDALRSV